MTKGELRIAFLGGGREVGRSALWIRGEKASLLLDYGVKVGDPAPSFPLHVAPRDLDAVVLTHAHLDHSGAIPSLYISGRCPLYATLLTAKTMEVLIRDFINLSGYYLPYEYHEVLKSLRHLRSVKPGDVVKVGEAKLSFIEAGHIPGGLQVLVEVDGKRILYTGDINTVDTRLLKGAPSIDEELDAVIIEATYAGVEHPNRLDLEAEFVKSAAEVVEDGGVVLTPAFSLGRSQEILCVLEAYEFEHRIYLDGMARSISQIFLEHPSFFRDFELLRRALKRAKWVEGGSQRNKLCKKPGVIIAPAGMLKGGPAVHYAKRIAESSRNAIFLVSYQIPGTPGHTLLHSGKLPIDGGQLEVKAQVKWFDFSSHVGDSQLKKLLKELSSKGSPKIFAIHGEEKSCLDLAEWVNRELGLEAYAPKNGEIFNL